jgi:uncharacterized membrane protein YfcA
VLFTPILLFLFPALDPGFPRLDINQAIAMGLIVEFVGYSSAALGYWRQRRVAFLEARSLLLITVPTAVLLSWVGSLVPDKILFLAFGVILFALTVLFVRFHRPETKAPCHSQQGTLAAPGNGQDTMKSVVDRSGVEYRYSFKYKFIDFFSSVFGGAFLGFIGIGLGEVTTTLLAVRHRFPLHLATATSVFVVAVTVLIAALTHVYLLFREETNLPWNLLAVMVLAVSIGGQLAPKLAGKLSEKFLKRALITMFLLVGVIMFFRAIIPQ